MTDPTTFEESTKVIIDLPVAHLVSEIPGVKEVAVAYLHQLTALAFTHIHLEAEFAGVLDMYECQVDDLGEIDMGPEAGRVRRVTVHAVPKQKPVKLERANV